MFLVVNGVEGKKYDWIYEDSLQFSPDGKKLAYIAREGNEKFVVVNGKEGKRYDWIDNFSLKFSPDGKKIAYIAGEGGKHDKFWISYEGGKYFVVVNGKEGKRYDYIDSLFLTFSPDGEKLAYVAKEGNKELVVVNEIEGKRYGRIYNLQFSPDGKRLAYIAKEGNKELIVLDSIESKKYDYIKKFSLQFSSDGKRLAYIASEGGKYDELGVHYKDGKYFVVIDGIEGKRYDYINEFSLQFSPDSKRVAYIAGEGGEYEIEMGRGVAYKDGKYFVVIDGIEGKRYDYINEFSLQFSPDSKRVAYIAGEGGEYDKLGVSHVKGKYFVVVDDTESERYDDILLLQFSPDSKKVIYVAIEGGIWLQIEGFDLYIGGKYIVVIDGKKSRKFDRLYSLKVNPDIKKSFYFSFQFTPDSKKLFYNARIGNEIWLIVEDLE